jgi:hypothetical protein
VNQPGLTRHGHPFATPPAIIYVHHDHLFGSLDAGKKAPRAIMAAAKIVALSPEIVAPAEVDRPRDSTKSRADHGARQSCAAGYGEGLARAGWGVTTHGQ